MASTRGTGTGCPHAFAQTKSKWLNVQKSCAASLPPLPSLTIFFVVGILAGVFSTRSKVPFPFQAWLTAQSLSWGLSVGYGTDFQSYFARTQEGSLRLTAFFVTPLSLAINKKAGYNTLPHKRGPHGGHDPSERSFAFTLVWLGFGGT